MEMKGIKGAGDINKNITGISTMDEFDYSGKTVILRLDVNSPIDPATKKIVSTNRIRKSIPTIKYLADSKAKIVLLAHQGDTLDYQNLISLEEHARILSDLSGIKIDYIDDVCGPAAQEAVRVLKPREAVLLGNLRYLTEEISTFEDAVKLKPQEMLKTYLIRNLAPLADYYVNDAFSAAHRNSPSMVAFQELLPSAGGILLIDEVEALTRVRDCPAKPSVFILGGAKISDAFGMMKQVLENGTADKILTCGIVGQVMLMAKGVHLGETTEKYIRDRSLDAFIPHSEEYLKSYPGKMLLPVDVAYGENGARRETSVGELPADGLLMDIGTCTAGMYKDIIGSAGTVFTNGPAGVYEDPLFEKSTKDILRVMSCAKGYTVIGGGDTVCAAEKYINTADIDYVSTAGGAMIRFLSGKKLPLIEVMTKAKVKMNAG